MNKLILMTCASAFAGVMAIADAATGVTFSTNGFVVVDGVLSSYVVAEVVVPVGVTEIGDDVFSCNDGIRKVILPDGVRKIGSDSFCCCSGLSDIVLPGSLEEIGNSAFANCWNLQSVSLPEGIRKIGASAFAYCESLSGIVIPESVVEIGVGAFNGCDSLVSNGFFIARGVLYVYTGKEPEVVVPDGVTEISPNVFCNKGKGVRRVILPDGLVKIGPGAFGGCKSLSSIVLPESLVEIGNGAFAGCASLERIEIPDGVGTVAYAAFRGCSRLKHVKVGKNFRVGDVRRKRVGGGFAGQDLSDTLAGIFEGCKSLETIEIDPANASLCVVDGFVYSKDRATLLFCPCAVTKETIVIPDGVTTVANIVSSQCDGLRRVVIPRGVVSIGTTVRRSKSFTEYVVDERNERYSSVDGLLLDKKGETLLACASGRNGHVKVPDSVKNIKGGAFDSCEGVAEVTIPDGVSKVDRGAFYGCKSLKKLSLPNALKGEIDDERVRSSCAPDLQIEYRETL